MSQIRIQVVSLDSLHPELNLFPHGKEKIKEFQDGKSHAILGASSFNKGYDSEEAMFKAVNSIEGICITTFYVPGYYMRYDPLGKYGIFIVRDSELTKVDGNVVHIMGLPRGRELDTAVLKAITDRLLGE